jgi:lipid-A-disaccharide synthase
MRAGEIIHREVSDVRFAVACYRESHARYARSLSTAAAEHVEVYCGKTPELIESATCTISVSGSVSLELLYHKKPSVIVYHVPWPLFAFQWLMRRVRYITLVNLLSIRDPLRPRNRFWPEMPDPEENILYPEYVAMRDVSQQLAGQVITWLSDSRLRNRVASRLEQLRSKVAVPGAAANAARLILQSISAEKPARRAA